MVVEEKGMCGVSREGGIWDMGGCHRRVSREGGILGMVGCHHRETALPDQELSEPSQLPDLKLTHPSYLVNNI